MVEVEVEPDRRRRADDAVAVQDDELPVLEKLDVFAVVARLEALVICERREADTLQFFELVGVLGPGLHDHEAVGESAVVPHGAGYCDDDVATGGVGNTKSSDV